MARTMAATDKVVYRAVVRAALPGTTVRYEAVYGPYSSASAARQMGAYKANERNRFRPGSGAYYEIEQATFEWEPVQ